jgi:hypothetical protein
MWGERLEWPSGCDHVVWSSLQSRCQVSASGISARFWNGDAFHLCEDSVIVA